MKNELKILQDELINDITHTESIVSTAKDLVAYLNLGPRFFRDLMLTISTLQELSWRTSRAVELQQLKPFLLATKQVKMMAIDLLNACKKNMYLA